MKKSVKIIKLTRKQIYDEVWSISISGMVKKYDMPYSVLWKQIKEAEIPIPSAGYWTKRTFGKEPVAVELTGNPDEVVELYKSGRKKKIKISSYVDIKGSKVSIRQSLIRLKRREKTTRKKQKTKHLKNLIVIFGSNVYSFVSYI